MVVVGFDGTPSGPTASASRADGTALPNPAVTVSGKLASLTLTAADHTNLLDHLAVTVTASVDGVPAASTVGVDVVGSDLVTLGVLRQEMGLSDSGRFPDWLLADYRDGYAEYVEQICGRAFTPRYSVVHTVGRGARSLTLPHVDVTAVRSATIDGETVDLSTVTILAGCMLARSGKWPAGDPVEVHIEHGMASPPARLVREVVRAIRRDLLARGAQAPSDMLWETVDGNTVRYSTPDGRAGRPTGVMALDAVLDRYSAHGRIA
jgi:hypothetical protein